MVVTRGYRKLLEASDTVAEAAARRLRHRLGHARYRLHALLIRTLMISTGRHWRRDQDFRLTGYRSGRAPEGEIHRLSAALDAARPTPLAAEDHLPGYAHNRGLGPFVAKLNSTHTYYEMGAEQLETLAPILRGLREEVAGCIGSPWRVVNVRGWRTPPNPEHAVGSDEWHTDGFPPSVLKLMLYVSGAGRTTGTTEIMLAGGSTLTVKGGPGTWILFKNSELLHRGVAPTLDERLLVEVTLIPSRRGGLPPVAAGTNAWFPANPFSRPSVPRP